MQYLLGNANLDYELSLYSPSLCVCVCVSNALFLYGSTGEVSGGSLTGNGL